jgi:hypothetical protein
MVTELSPSESEGVVVCDANFNRIKLKSPAYVAFNRLHDTLSSSHKNCLELIILKKEDDVIPMLPKLIGDRMVRIKAAYVEMLRRVELDYNRLKDIESQKEFALEAVKCINSSPLFALRNKKTGSIDSFFENGLDSAKLVSILKILEKIDEGVGTE